MTTRFLTETSGLIRFLIGSTIIILLGLICYLIFMVGILNAETIIIGVVAGSVILLLLWIRFGTYYQLFKDKLVAASGPFVWNIKIRDIEYIRLNQSTFGGTYKATLSLNGMEIRYGRNRSLLISPRQQERFINKLKELNSRIEIKER
ncbi:MAG: PH domain-containing protein [Bacteroidetes bacterium]|nr:PH domain-containing protein [Bacteroidota bacterium]